MQIDRGWQCLDWDLVCDTAPKIDKLYRSSFNDDICCWWSFVNDELKYPEMYEYAQEWWDSLPIQKQVDFLTYRVDNLQEKLYAALRVRTELRSKQGGTNV